MSEPPTTRPRGDSRWFRPPRRHGEVLAHRTVSYLELFYDLVFVVLIAQISRSLAGDVTWVGVRDFLIVFALIWIAWVNGTLYHDLHGREDGRSRTYIFAQVSLLVLLSVFTVQAAEDPTDGRGFAIVFTLLVMLIAWQWFEVRRFDTPEWRPVAGRYVQGIVIIAVIVAISAALDNQDVRLALWGIAVGLSLAGNLVMTLRPRSDQMVQATRVTESLAERFGLFTIIVLGEVVVGVANGLAASEHDFRTIATGLIALSIGFGFWWNYFDFVGGRVPGVGRARVAWMYGHLPLAIGISATGAGMIGLVEHAGDGRTPTATAWLISASTATVALSIAVLTKTIAAHSGRRLVSLTLAVAAGASLIAGAARPAPWLLALILSGLLFAVWLEAFARHVRGGTMISDHR